MTRFSYSVCGVVAAAVLVASGCSKPAESELLLDKARRLVQVSPDGATITSLRTVAECDGPGASWTTEMRSSADGRALMQQRYPDGTWFWLQMEPEGGVTRSSTSPDPVPMDAKWRSFVQGHELHFAALALDSRHGDLQLESGTSFEGQAADALIWVDELGGENRSFYRAADALPLGLELTNHLGGPTQVTVRFSDWPEEGDHRLFRAATILQGDDEFHFRFQVIEVNPPLDSLYVVEPEHGSPPT